MKIKEKNKLINNLSKLWPINRSITGKGFIKSCIVKKEVKFMKIKNIKTGTRVFDWSYLKFGDI